MRVFISLCLLLILLPVISNAQDFWESLEGPPAVQISEGVEVNNFIVLGHDTVFACLDEGVVMSLDEGLTWERRTNGLPPDRLISMATDSAGVLIVVSYLHGAFRSTDAGKHWISLNDGIEPPPEPFYEYDLWDVTYNHFDNTWYVASSNSMVMTSTDAGDTWTSTSLDTLKINFRAILTTENGNVLVCSQYGIYTWIRNENRWIRSADGAYDLHRAGRRIYAITGGFNISDDQGLTWSNDKEGPENLSLRHLFDMGDHGLIAVSESIMMTTHVFQSLDTGNTWQPIDELSRRQEYLQAMSMLPSGRMLAGDWYGIFRSDPDGKNWTRILDGIEREHAMDVVRTEDKGIIVGTIYGLHMYQDASEIWNPLISEGGVSRVHVHQSGTLLCLAWMGILRTEDGGVTWDTTRSNFYRASQLLENKSGVLYCGVVDSTIYRSYDAGASWSAGSLTVKHTMIMDGVISDDGSLFLLSDKSGVLHIDSALTRAEILLPLSTTGDVVSMALEPGGALLVSAWNGVFRSSDNGVTWRKLPSPDPGHTGPFFMDTDSKGTVYCLFRMYDNPADYRTYRGTELFSTSNHGVTWEPMDLPQPYQWYTLTKVLSDDRLYIASKIEGLFRSRDVLTSVDRDLPPRLPARLDLKIWPQPASTTVTLAWKNHGPMHTLLLHDYAGRIVDRRSLSGYSADHRIVYDVGRLNAGAYFFTVIGREIVLRGRVLITPNP